MRGAWFAGLALLAVVLDSVFAPEIEILGARPDFLVLVVAYAGLVLGARPATIIGFAVGLVVDSEHPEYLGLHALALTAVGFATAVAWEHLVRGSVFVQMAVLFGAALMHDIIFYAVWYSFHIDILARFMMRYGLIGGAYTAAFAILIYALARALAWRKITGGTRI